MAKLHVKKGDTVVVIAGKDKGKSGKVLVAQPANGTVIVEGVNFIIKHKKAKSAQDKSSIVKKEGALSVSNVQLLDENKKATRAYHKMVGGRNVRMAKSGSVLEVAYVKKAAKKAADKKADAVKEKEVAPAPKATKSTAKPKTAPKTVKEPRGITEKVVTREKSTTNRARNQER